MQRVVYDRFAPRMLAICVRYVKNDMEAEELMVNGFLKVFAKIDQFKNEGSFEGWIRRIMVNESLNHLRSKRMMYAEVDIEKVGNVIDYNSVENDFSTEELYLMIAQMPVGYRTVFNLFAIEGYSHKEISEKLGINENTSKSQLSRARTHLQKLIEDNNKKLNDIQYG